MDKGEGHKYKSLNQINTDPTEELAESDNSDDDHPEDASDTENLARIHSEPSTSTNLKSKLIYFTKNLNVPSFYP